MNLRELNYNIDMDGISPGVEQFGGTQGDHRVTKLNFVFSDKFNQEIDELGAEGYRLMYRVDVYNGEGGIWQSEPTELIDNTVSVELEERHTRFGGKITVYLVITALSQDNETQVELYSFPVVLQLKNRPEGVYQEGENYESISGLAEITKQKADEASLSAIAAENSKKELQEIAAIVEEKLKNGEYDGVGVEAAEIIDDELIITYTNGVIQNLGNVKGDAGQQGVKGDKGDAGKDAVTDQTYNAESENAQSGKAVAEALTNHYTKVEIDNLDSVQNVRRFKVDKDTGLSITSPSGNQYIDLYDNSDMDINVDGHNINVSSAKILNVATPEDDTDAATKGYVDSTAKLKMPRITEGDQLEAKAIIIKQNAKLQEIDGKLYPADSDYQHLTIDPIYNKTSPKPNVLVVRDAKGNLYTGEPVDNEDCVNKKYVDDAVSNLSGLKLEVVLELPEIGRTDTLYFVPSSLTTTEQNLCDEFIYLYGSWEKIGSVPVEFDLTNYVKNTDIATASTAGVVKVKDFYGISVSSDGAILGMVYDVDKYATRDTSAIISKGTLDNVLAEKLGDIESLLGGI